MASTGPKREKSSTGRALGTSPLMPSSTLSCLSVIPVWVCRTIVRNFLSVKSGIEKNRCHPSEGPGHPEFLPLCWFLESRREKGGGCPFSRRLLCGLWKFWYYRSGLRLSHER